LLALLRGALGLLALLRLVLGELPLLRDLPRPLLSLLLGLPLVGGEPLRLLRLRPLGLCDTLLSDSLQLLLMLLANGALALRQSRLLLRLLLHRLLLMLRH
jgi:hypothetical protein